MSHLSSPETSPQTSRLPPVRLREDARILVVKMAGIGDLLLAVPALRALRATYRQARIDLLVTPQSAGLLRDSALVDRLLVFDKARWDHPKDVVRAPRQLGALAGLWRTLRASRYDAALIMHHQTLPFGRLKYRLLLYAARPALSVGLENGLAGFFDVGVPDQGFGAQHEAAYCLEIVGAVGAATGATLSAPTLADLGWDEPESPARHIGPPLVALHPGSGSYSLARRWPLERFADLARMVHAEYAARIVIVGGPDDGSVGEQLVEVLGNPGWVVSLAGALHLRDTAHLLGQAALFVGNDSLPAHLAAAAGTPVIAIFGPSNHRAWAPLARPGREAIVVRRDLACSPCFYRGHALGTPNGCPARPCLTELDVAVVAAQARRLLREGEMAPASRSC